MQRRELLHFPPYQMPSDKNHDLSLRTVHNPGLFIVFLWKAFHKRKNWIHIGSQEAGPRVAAILSLVETCRRLKLPT